MTLLSAARCGTTSGYAAHQYRDEKPCDACAAAKAAYDARRNSTPERVRLSRLFAKAQAVANRRLAAAHRDEYSRYYAETKAELKAEVPS